MSQAGTFCCTEDGRALRPIVSTLKAAARGLRGGGGRGAKPVAGQLTRKAVGEFWIGRHDGELGLARGAALEHLAQGERHHHDERSRHQEQHREPENVAREREPFLSPQGEQAAHQSLSDRWGSCMKSSWRPEPSRITSESAPETSTRPWSMIATWSQIASTSSM